MTKEEHLSKYCEKNVMLIAGTTEAREVVQRLQKEGANITAFTATKLGADMLIDTNCECEIGRKDAVQFRQSFIQYKADVVIDASHPFAKVVTQTVKDVCEKMKLPYVRVEREEETYDYDNIIWAKDADEAADIAKSIEGTILLTTGANTAHIYAQKVGDLEKIYIRVLDTPKSLELCKNAGILEQHVIAQMPPFSVEDNIALIKKINAAAVVSKDSGEKGGVPQKVEACKTCNIPIILIKRPKDTL